MKNWFVYIIETKKNKLYTGITTDVDKRFQTHLSGKGAKYFRTDTPIKVVYTQQCENKSQACKREIEIKKLSRSKKDELINSKKL